jgi:hypothetical protein
MHVKDVVAKIGPVVGASSMIAALLGGDVSSVNGKQQTEGSLADAKKHLAQLIHAQNTCQSDYAYWGYMGQISYWRAIVDILTAADLVGADNLADVPYDDSPTIVMDACSRIENYGKAVLSQAKE